MRKDKTTRHRAALALAQTMEQTRRSHPHALGIPGWQRPYVTKNGVPALMHCPADKGYGGAR